jgi:ribonuclease E
MKEHAYDDFDELWDCMSDYVQSEAGDDDSHTNTHETEDLQSNEDEFQQADDDDDDDDDDEISEPDWERVVVESDDSQAEDSDDDASEERDDNSEEESEDDTSEDENPVFPPQCPRQNLLGEEI